MFIPAVRTIGTKALRIVVHAARAAEVELVAVATGRQREGRRGRRVGVTAKGNVLAVTAPTGRATRAHKGRAVLELALPHFNRQRRVVAGQVEGALAGFARHGRIGALAAVAVGTAATADSLQVLDTAAATSFQQLGNLDRVRIVAALRDGFVSKQKGQQIFIFDRTTRRCIAAAAARLLLVQHFERVLLGVQIEPGRRVLGLLALKLGDFKRHEPLFLQHTVLPHPAHHRVAVRVIHVRAKQLHATSQESVLPIGARNGSGIGRTTTAARPRSIVTGHLQGALGVVLGGPVARLLNAAVLVAGQLVGALVALFAMLGHDGIHVVGVKGPDAFRVVAQARDFACPKKVNQKVALLGFSCFHVGFHDECRPPGVSFDVGPDHASCQLQIVLLVAQPDPAGIGIIIITVVVVIIIVFVIIKDNFVLVRVGIIAHDASLFPHAVAAIFVFNFDLPPNFAPVRTGGIPVHRRRERRFFATDASRGHVHLQCGFRVHVNGWGTSVFFV